MQHQHKDITMSKIANTGGAVALVSGFNASFRSFDYDYQMPEVDVTGFDDGGFMTFEPAGGLRLTGSAQGVHEFDASTTVPMPASLADGSALALGDLSVQSGTLTLTFTTGCTLAATCLITSISGSRAEVGASESSWSFGSTGAVTQAWDETP